MTRALLWPTRLLGASVLALGAGCSFAQPSAPASSAPLPQVASGRIERLANFASRHVAPRHVDVWLPADYSSARRYAVLYMHDGQNLFDDRLAFGGKSWRAADAVARLVQAGRVPDTIIVGIWNAGLDRYAEYYPQKALALAPEAVRREYVLQASNGQSKADAYLRFIVEELKPAIDQRYATRRERGSTFVAGSSMGGLISIYALCEYPQVFGGAAALSTHWVGRPSSWGRDRLRNAALPLAAMNYLASALPKGNGAHRIYSDRGDDWLDALYAPAHQMFTEVLRDQTYTSANAWTRVVEGSGHNETDWSARLDEVLGWLMGAR